MLRTKGSDTGVQPLGDCPLKCAGDLTRRTSSRSVVDYRLKQGAEVEFVAGEGKWRHIQSGRAFRQVLQPNRSLPFKGRLSDKAEQGRGRVKKPSHRCSRKCAHPSTGELQ